MNEEIKNKLLNAGFKEVTNKLFSLTNEKYLIDIAKGKDDWGLYFRIGETFGDK